MVEFCLVDEVIRMGTRRRFLLMGGIGLIAVHPLSRGQPAAVTHRVGVLVTTSEATNAPLRAAFSQAMRDLGWVEGMNIEYRIVSANGDVDRLDALANELIRQNVELIVAASSAGTRAAQRATKTIPIVMVSASNAVDSGFVASLAKPGGNITGVSNQREEALQKLARSVIFQAAPLDTHWRKRGTCSLRPIGTLKTIRKCRRSLQPDVNRKCLPAAFVIARKGRAAPRTRVSRACRLHTSFSRWPTTRAASGRLPCRVVCHRR